MSPAAAPRRISLEALVLSLLLKRGAQGARLDELEALVEAAAAAGLLALPPGRSPSQALIDYLAYLKRNRTIEVDGDRFYLDESKISPMLLRVLARTVGDLLSLLEGGGDATRLLGAGAVAAVAARLPETRERHGFRGAAAGGGDAHDTR